MIYSSPQAYLNKFFKGKNKFQCSIGAQVEYENINWLLTHIEGEQFVLSVRVQDFDTGADYFDDIFEGSLIECVIKIKETL